MFDEGRIRCLSGQMVLDLIRGNFNRVALSFSKEMSKDTNVEKLEEAWAETVRELGEYIAVLSCRLKETEGHMASETIVLYDEAKLKIKLLLNQEEEINELCFNHFSHEPLSDQPRAGEERRRE